MEYVYHLMATNCGIDMAPCHLIDEGARRHFVTKRFDREGNKKIHTQTLTAINHVDYNSPGSYSYEELFATARQLKLPVHDAKQLFTRMAFNLIARNNDDHSKNFAFIYKVGQWRLSP
jgi:serine/threonine-protein kinase HipA